MVLNKFEFNESMYNDVARNLFHWDINEGNSLTTSSSRFNGIVDIAMFIVIVNSSTPSGGIFIKIVVINTITFVVVVIINPRNTSSGR